MPSYPTRGFRVSFGTRLLSFFALIGALLCAAGALFFASTSASEKLLNRQRELSLEVDRIADRWPRPSEGTVESSAFQFQVLSPKASVLWDSQDASRRNRVLQEAHPFLQFVRNHTQSQGETPFLAPGSGLEFQGAFRRLEDGTLILGAFPQSSIRETWFSALFLGIRFSMILLGIGITLAALGVGRMLRPLRALVDSSLKAEEGSTESFFEESTRDEFGDLARGFRSLQDRVQVLLAGEARSSRMEEEVNIAAEIQSRLLPPPELRFDTCEVRSFYQSATETGGDFWGCFEAEGVIFLYVGDVTGHGLPSALVTAGVRGSLSPLIKAGSSAPTLRSILAAANRAVSQIGSGEMQMTLFVAAYEQQTGSLKYSSAGHPPAWLFRRESLPASELLQARGPRLGEEPEYAGAEENEVRIHPGDTLMLYTDGILHPLGTESGVEGRIRWKEKIGTLLLESEPLEKAKTAIEFQLFEATGGQPPADDITFTLMRVHR